jgi:methyl-accepting chemotaxis protein
MKLGDLKLKNKMFFGNAIFLVLVIILGGITFTTTKSLLNSSKMVDHTHVVIEHAMDTLGAAVNTETGMRGYLLAGKEDFLAPYTSGHKTFLEEIDDLKS